MRTIICLFISATGLAAAPYSNATFHYAFDVPAGWTAQEKGGPGVVLVSPAKEADVAIQIFAVKKTQALLRADVARFEGAEAAALKKKHGTAVKPVAFDPKPVAGLTTHAFGFLFKDAKGVVLVSRSILFEKLEGEVPHWFRVNATFPKARLQAVTKDLETLLASFRFVAPGGAPTQPQAVATPAPDAATATTGGAGGAPGPAQATAKTRKSRYRADRSTNMGSEVGKSMDEAFKASTESRTEEEKEKARAYFGGLGNPNQ
jgi:hypothetical protein